jgi:5,10-methylene-tetrahydrofolate dehydrogenase/methenyl tetrahydrofolate cyclohydrolase
VTVAPSRPRNLPEIPRQADTLIAAIGQAQFIRAEHARESAMAFNAGINRINSPSMVENWKKNTTKNLHSLLIALSRRLSPLIALSNAALSSPP